MSLSRVYFLAQLYPGILCLWNVLWNIFLSPKLIDTSYPWSLSNQLFYTFFMFILNFMLIVTSQTCRVNPNKKMPKGN